jgi:hypothetical protein
MRADHDAIAERCCDRRPHACTVAGVPAASDIATRNNAEQLTIVDSTLAQVSIQIDVHLEVYFSFLR